MEIDNIIKKMCHNCLKKQELNKYRTQVMRVKNERFKYEQNICINCEELGVKQKKVWEAGAISTITHNAGFYEENGKDVGELGKSYECAFVGNTSYKDICKVFKIKHIEE